MINRFKWCVCFVLVLTMHFVLFPLATNAASTKRVGKILHPTEPAVQNDPTQPPLNPESVLQVVIKHGQETATPGDIVRYDVTVTNTAAHESASGILLMDLLPGGFRIKKGSVTLNSVNAPDPTIFSNGKALSFTIGTLAPTASSTISFMAETGADSTPGKAVNVASAISSGKERSNIATSTITVRASQQQAKVEVQTTSAVPPETLAPSAPVKNSGTPATAESVSQAAVPVLTPVVPAPVVSAPPASPQVSATDAATIPLTTSVAANKADTAQVPDSSPQTQPSDAPDKETPQADSQATGGNVAPETRNLAALIGKFDISVLSDVDGQFVKNMAENQILENEFAGLVEETSLLASISAGRSFSRESLAAFARTEQAKAQTGQAFGLMLPSVSVHANSGIETSNPSVTADKSSDTHSRTDASLTARQSLFDLPTFMDWRRRKVIEQARGESYRGSDGDSYISAVNAYLSLVASRLQTDMTREFETQLNELLIYVEKRAKAGAASNSDMARVRARSEATLSSRLEQEAAHAAAGVEFVRLTNLVPRKVRLPGVEDVGVSLLPKSVDSAVTAAMKFNPEITSLAAELQAAEIDLSAAKGRYLPRVDAEYTNNLSLHAGGDPSSFGQRDQRIMMVLNWSLFSGGSDYMNQVERVARRKELQYRLDDQRRRVVQALSANYATLATTRERITSGYQELKSISTAAEAMSKRMLSGNQSLLDLLDVYDRFYQVRSRLVSLHILEMNTVAQLVRLTRGVPESTAKVIAAPTVPGVSNGTPAPLSAN